MMMLVMKLLKNTYDAILSISWPTFPCRSVSSRCYPSAVSVDSLSLCISTSLSRCSRRYAIHCVFVHTGPTRLQ